MQYITEYNPNWPKRFKLIVAVLCLHLPDTCLFHHVGSTSIPGMPAKEIIDIDIECLTGSMVDVIQALATFGYEHEGDKGILTREAFRPLLYSTPSKFPMHHLYACEVDSPELFKHLAYREYLKAHPAKALWLASQKRLADEEASSRQEYIANKSDAYAIITEESLSWAKTVNLSVLVSPES